MLFRSVDLTDGWPLFEVNVKDPTFGALFALKADVFKIAGIPQGVEVAFNGGVVIDIADFGEDSSFDGVGRNAAVAVNHDADDEVLLRGKRGNQERKSD